MGVSAAPQAAERALKAAQRLFPSASSSSAALGGGEPCCGSRGCGGAELSGRAGDRGSSGQVKAEHGSRCQQEQSDQPPQESWAAGLDGEETRGEDMAVSNTSRSQVFPTGQGLGMGACPLCLGRALAHMYDYDYLT